MVWKRRPPSVTRARRPRLEFEPGKWHLARVVAGRRDAALGVLHELELRAQTRYVPAYYIAVVHLGLRDTPATMRWLERAYNQRDPHLVFLAVDPKWDVLRQQPEFASVIAKLRLPALGS